MKTRNRSKPNKIISLEDQGLLEVRFINTYIGSGVFAKSDVTKGTFVCVYTGEIISEKEGLKRLDKNTKPGCFWYFFKKDGKTSCVDGTHSAGVGKYINDDYKKPNCKVKLVKIDGQLVLAVYALRDIREDTELRYDYGDDQAYWRKKHAESEFLYEPPEAETLPVSSGVQQCRNTIGDEQLQDDPPFPRNEIMDADSEAKTLPVSSGVQQCRNTIGDEQLQEDPPSPRDEIMDADSEAETLPVSSGVQQCRNTIGDEHLQDDPSFPRNEIMDADSEAETLPVSSGVQQCRNTIGDEQLQEDPRSPRDEIMDADSEAETLPVSSGVQQCRNTIGDEHLQDDPSFPRNEIMDADSEAKTLPVSSGVQQCRNTIGDEQLQEDPPSPRDEIMDADSEAETLPVSSGVQQCRNTIGDEHLQDDPSFPRNEIMDADSEAETLPVSSGVQQCRNTIGDEQLQEDPRSPRDEIMDADSEAETLPVSSGVQQCRNTIGDEHLQDDPSFPRNEIMDADSEAETLPVFSGVQQCSNTIGDEQLQEDPPSPRDEIIDSDSEAETLPVSAGVQQCRNTIGDEQLHPRNEIMDTDSGDVFVDDSALDSDDGSEVFSVLPMLSISSLNSQIQDGYVHYDDDVQDPDYQPEVDSEEDNSDHGNLDHDLGFQSLLTSAETIQNSSVTSTSEEAIKIPVVTVEKRSDNLAKGQRDFKRKHTCFVCSKKVCDIPRHASVAHKDADLVKAALEKPKGSKERRAIWKVFINRGTYKANMKAKAVGGDFQVSKRTGGNRKPNEYQPCIHCYGYFLKKDLWRHTKKCSFSIFAKKSSQKNCIQSNITGVSAIVDSASYTAPNLEGLLEKCYEQMKLKDDVYMVVKNDKLLKLYTKNLIEEGKSQMDLSWTIRLLGKLLLKARDLTSNENLSWTELLDHVNWTMLATGIKSLARFSYDQDKLTVEKPNIGIKCGQGVRSLIAVFEGYALSIDDDFLLEKAKKMFMNFEKEWPKLRNRCKESRKNEIEDQEENLLPLTTDITKLKEHCVRQIRSVSLEVQKECNPQNYRQLAVLVLARLISFNARRGGEPGKLKLSQWQSINEGKGIHKEEFEALPAEERLLAERLRLGYVIGKGQKTVPILFPEETVSAINLLIKYRASVMSSDKNPYVFGRLHKGSVKYMRGSDCMRQVCKEAELKHSNLITATQLRKYLSTTLQLTDMTEAELRWVTDHMGHTVDVHKRWYRLSNKTVELSKVASILVAAETGRLQKAHSIPFNDIGASLRTSNEPRANPQEMEADPPEDTDPQEMEADPPEDTDPQEMEANPPEDTDPQEMEANPKYTEAVPLETGTSIISAVVAVLYDLPWETAQKVI